MNLHDLQLAAPPQPVPKPPPKKKVKDQGKDGFFYQIETTDPTLPRPNIPGTGGPLHECDKLEQDHPRHWCFRLKTGTKLTRLMWAVREANPEWDYSKCSFGTVRSTSVCCGDHGSHPESHKLDLNLEEGEAPRRKQKLSESIEEIYKELALVTQRVAILEENLRQNNERIPLKEEHPTNKKTRKPNKKN